jgi:hypothetical protein
MNDNRGLNRTLATLAFLASAIVLCMVVGIFATGFSQEFFQLAPSIGAVAEQLSDQPAHAFGLRLNLGLDNLFIVVYCAFFVLLAVRLRGLLSPVTIGVALAALLLTGLLDALDVSSDELKFQMVESNLKFHASYIGSFLFAFGFFRLGGLGRVIAWLLWLGYVPLGMITFAVPAETTVPFALARTAFFVLAFALAGVHFLRNQQASFPAATWHNEENIGAARA